MSVRKPVTPSGASTYTYLFPQHVVQDLVGVVDGQPLTHVLGRHNMQSDFSRFRIAVGDTLIPVHVVAGAVCPIARMTVAYKGTVGDWRKSHKGFLPGVHPTTQVMVGTHGAPMGFNRPLPPELTRSLRYDSETPRPLKLHDDGRLKSTHGIDGVFRLCPESADELLWLPWL